MAVLLIFGAAIARAKLPLFRGRHGWNSTLVLRRGAQARLLKRLDERVLVPLQVVDGLLHVLELLAHLVALLDAALQLPTDLRDHLHAALQLLVRIIRRRSRAWRASCRLFEMGGEGLVGRDELADAREFEQVVRKTRG